MRRLKTILLIGGIILTGILGMTGCSRNSNNPNQNSTIYKDKEEVKQVAEDYLEEKYGKEFVAVISDNPNHLYSSYQVSAYAADDESKEFFTVTVTYYDEETYGVTDDYFMYSIKDDLEIWFKELADPYIDSEFKVFYLSSGSLPTDYNDCATLEDFLKISPTSIYYGLRYKILLPASEWDTDINKIADNIVKEMLNRRIRGQVTIVIYEEAYNRIITKNDERHFWTHSYKHKSCTSTLKTDFIPISN